jgi:DNA-binding CsgD family transcriptional regulator
VVKRGGRRIKGQTSANWFTPREWHLIALQSQAYSDKQIADLLSLSIGTVKQGGSDLRLKAHRIFDDHVGRRNDRYLFIRIMECTCS